MTGLFTSANPEAPIGDLENKVSNSLGPQWTLNLLSSVKFYALGCVNDTCINFFMTVVKT